MNTGGERTDFDENLHVSSLNVTQACQVRRWHSNGDSEGDKGKGGSSFARGLTDVKGLDGEKVVAWN